ncbi:MAG: hypothetical protein K0R24_1022 [Gammaproteobacteria bacterium]|jgi:hypothetical protein|nr:hypothetical protein [Gammaproteobacteria bacterium]
MQNIDIIIKPSRQFITLITVIFTISIGIILTLPLHTSNKLLLMIPTILYSFRIFWIYGAMRDAHSIQQLQLLSEGMCRLYNRDRFIEGKIRGDSTVTTSFCLLRFFIPRERKNKSCILFRDAMDKTSYRQLLIWLRCIKIT